MGTFAAFLDPSDFMPHGMCYLWRPEILGLHVVSDAVTAASYFAIPLAIVVVLRRRPDFGYRTVPLLFTAFILTCGITHLLAIVVIWFPIYGVEGLAKLATALASLITAVVLWRLVPAICRIPSQAQLEARNVEIDELNLRLQRRIEGMETLAGGVAHDFNNFLQLLRGNVELLRGAEGPAEQHELLDELEAVTGRGETLAARMLAFSGTGTMAPRTADLRAIVGSLCSEERVACTLGDADLRARVAPDLVELALRELLANAREAVEGGEGGVRIRVRRVRVSGDEAAAGDGSPTKPLEEAVEIAVEDDGPGLPEALRERAVEPYFSTRAQGRGLGLAVVQGVCRSQGGVFSLRGTGEGTVATLRFPALEGAAT